VPVTTYLKRFYFDDWKLRQRALLEFFRSLHTGRMIAFTGSMSTESYGYGSWDKLVTEYVAQALRLAEDSPEPSTQKENWLAAKDIILKVSAELSSKGKSLHDKRVALSIVKEALSVLDSVAPSSPPSPKGSFVERLAQFTADRYKERKAADPADPAIPAAIHPILSELGLNRFATLNYDIELEARLMGSPDEAPLAMLEAVRKEQNRSSPQPGSHRLRRLMLNGRAVESDIRDREHPDRMIDFAVGSVGIDQRIMHLHGRACSADTLIVGLRDYDRLYRKDDLAKLPFEHGQRILFGGNPVLFVGVGMSEPEMNATLQTFVSNNPYRRFAPTFLLWNAGDLEEEEDIRARKRALRRIDFLQRLGIFMIFDEDLVLSKPYEDLLKSSRDLALIKKKKCGRLSVAQTKTLYDNKLRMLGDSIRELGETARKIDTHLRYVGSHWRTMLRRIEKVGGDDIVRLWGSDSGTKKRLFDLRPLPAPPQDNDSFSHAVIIAENGAGKGTIARLLAEADLEPPFDAAKGNRLLINAGFAFDTDSLLGSIAQLLAKLQRRPGLKPLPEPKTSRETQFVKPKAFSSQNGQMLIIINGMERFFDLNGAPLSAELDHLLRCIAGTTQSESQVRWIFLGSERIRRYFETVSPAAINDFDDICERTAQTDGQFKRVKGLYLSSLLERLAEVTGKSPDDLFPLAAKMLLQAKSTGGAEARRRGALAALLNPETLAAAKIDPDLGLEILRTMAFIGTPVEDVVLFHSPRVRAKLLKDGKLEPKTLKKALAGLQRIGLVVRIEDFERNPTTTKYWGRFGLHRSVATELRYQFGIPLSESKLSTAFNMSLYVAQPVDGHVPEPQIHDELAKLIDHLIGAYKDQLHDCEKTDFSRVPNWKKALTAVGNEFVPPLPAKENEEPHLSPTCTPAASAAMRAALAVVRGYYSTTSLLTIDREDRLASDDRDGVLLEHAERLERLLRTYRKLSRFREAIFRQCEKIGDPKRRRKAEDALGPEPFYPDDIVWIHNELGVVYLAQGDLYSARWAFQQARQVNTKAVEFECRSHNWRRITLNEVLLDIERARLVVAEQRLSEIQRSINERPDLRPGRNRKRPARSRFARIRRKFGEAGGAAGACFDDEVMHEEILMTGLVLGFRGLCHHIRGQLKVARPLYKDALAILRRLGEQRAYALFQRHYAQLRSALDPADRAKVEMRFAVAAAESVRQMDMAYHSRITQAEVMWLADPSDSALRRRALIQANDALSYAAVMDIYRLRIEADVRLARLKLDSGDYETALEHATEAMTLASRFGHSLRKIALRILMGRILIRRGDRQSGEALIDGAVQAADRFGYQGAIEAARKARAAEVEFG
jgi:tetratricopeptide (TPR) repeat protein